MIGSHSSPSVRELQPPWPPARSVESPKLFPSRGLELKTLSLKRSCLLVPTADSSRPSYLLLSLPHPLASSSSPPAPPRDPPLYLYSFITISNDHHLLISAAPLYLPVKGKLLACRDLVSLFDHCNLSIEKYLLHKDSLRSKARTRIQNAKLDETVPPCQARRKTL